MKYAKVWWIVLLSLAVIGCRNNSMPEAAEDTAADFDSAQGVLTYPVELKGVFVQLESPQVFSAEDDGHEGFAYVLLRSSWANNSDQPVVPAAAYIVDSLGNKYVQRPQGSASVSSQLTNHPLILDKGESTQGHQLYLVPLSALNAGLMLRWESETHQSRIDVVLGNLGP